MKLDELLGSTEPHGTFHDARLVDLHIDYGTAILLARFDLCVGHPDGPTEADRERRRGGRIELRGLLFWAIDPPTDPIRSSGAEPWLTSDGLLNEAPTESGKRLAAAVPTDAVAWYLYFSDLNAFAYCAAHQATFQWL
jgi:hypothetical protein